MTSYCESLPDVTSVLSAQRRIREHVVRTPLVRSGALSAASGAEVLLKLETEQPSGSFKVRGAGNAMLRLLEDGPVDGVTTASTGNHARAVAYMGRRLGLDVHAYVSGNVSDRRVAMLEEMGAHVDRSSAHQSAAISAAEQYATEHRYGFIPPFDHPDVISGQGTAGLEIMQDADDLDAVVVPVSGGGLVCGIGLAVKGLHPSTTVVGVCADRSPAMYESLAVGHPVAIPEIETVAESLMGDLGADNRYTFRLASAVVDRIVTVTDEEILAAMRLLHVDEGLELEPSAAAAAAFVLRPGAFPRGARLATVVTGNGD